MEWISVKKKIPEIDVEVLTYGNCDICTAQISWFDNDTEPHWMCKSEFQVKPTHWMPLPEPPEYPIIWPIQWVNKEDLLDQYPEKPLDG